ncbi:MAG TPA: hypothetical protein VFI27_15290 [candidate division Zixibacteria bacterium]|nr:hypothetical protein [candidate division Zixibacteria bacterium]
MADMDIEVLRVIRKPPMGKLAIEVNSVQFERLSDIPTATIRQRILAAVGDMIVFVDGYDTLVQAGMAPPLSGSADDGANYASSVTERQEAFKTQVARQQYEAQLAASQVQPAPKKVESKAKSNAADSIVEELSIVEQIDVIFQKYLAQDASLQGRIARLESIPEGGLRIRVDSIYYSQPKEIEDKRIRRALTLALREWESGR